MLGTGQRPIRSYVLREGRLTTGQQRALLAHWSEYGIDWPPQTMPFDPTISFGNHYPIILEIGFGDGEHLLHLAQTAPNNNYLGIEVHRPGVGHLINRLATAQLPNVRIIRQDATEVLMALKPASLHSVYLLFPDPWPKQRHHKRRLVQPAWLELVASRLVIGGLLHLATDWQDYAEQMLLFTNRCPLLTNLSNGFSQHPTDRPTTKFERRGQRLGHSVWNLQLQRC